jgi:hypothetical protein
MDANPARTFHLIHGAIVAGCLAALIGASLWASSTPAPSPQPTQVARSK